MAVILSDVCRFVSCEPSIGRSVTLAENLRASVVCTMRVCDKEIVHLLVKVYPLFPTQQVNGGSKRNSADSPRQRGFLPIVLCQTGYPNRQIKDDLLYWQ
jgi:hypothetical protein